MNTNEIQVFDGKSLADLFKEIYFNSVDKREKIHGLIEDLRPFIKNIGDAAMLVPIIKEYMDVSVKNDEHLVKLAVVVQRLAASQASAENGNEFGISEEEKKQLIKEAENYYTQVMAESKEEIK